MGYQCLNPPRDATAPLYILLARPPMCPQHAPLDTHPVRCNGGPNDNSATLDSDRILSGGARWPRPLSLTNCNLFPSIPQHCYRHLQKQWAHTADLLTLCCPCPSPCRSRRSQLHDRGAPGFAALIQQCIKPFNLQEAKPPNGLR